jgi:hypothetical protein
LSLYLQLGKARDERKQTGFAKPPQPILERHSSILLYFMAEHRQFFFKCWNNRMWESYTMVLQGAGTLSNAETCYVTSEGVQLHPELSGDLEYRAQVPLLYIPTSPAVISTNEWETLSSMPEVNTDATEQLEADVVSHQVDTDIDSLIQVHNARVQYTQKLQWIIPGLTAAGAVLSLFILYYFTHPYFGKLLELCQLWKTPEENQTFLPQTLPPPTKLY